MKRILVSAFLCVFALQSSGQADSSRPSLTLAAIYSSNASYYGQVASEKLPYVVANATLRFPSGIYFSGMAYKLLDNSTGIVSATNLGAGIDFNLGKKITADINFNHTFFPENSPFLHAANTNNLGATLTYNHWLSTGITADYAFGKDQDMFFTFSNSKMINLGSLSPNDLVSISPAFDIIGGTRKFYQTYMIEKNRRDSILGIPLPFPGQTETETKEESFTDFDLISYNLRLPLAYSRASYMIEASYQASLPGKKEEGELTVKDIRSFFNLSFYYQF